MDMIVARSSELSQLRWRLTTEFRLQESLSSVCRMEDCGAVIVMNVHPTCAMHIECLDTSRGTWHPSGCQYCLAIVALDDRIFRWQDRVVRSDHIGRCWIRKLQEKALGALSPSLKEIGLLIADKDRDLIKCSGERCKAFLKRVVLKEKTIPSPPWLGMLLG